MSPTAQDRRFDTLGGDPINRKLPAQVLTQGGERLLIGPAAVRPQLLGRKNVSTAVRNTGWRR